MTPPPLHSACAFVLALFASAHAAAQPAGPIPKEELQILASVYRELQTSLVEKPDDRALLVAATKGMVREADPDSGEYFTAAEIVAAALQDHRRARVFGRPTAGRGSIQTIRPMQKGAIKFTTAYWISPGGRSIQGNGVAPDQIVADPSAQSTLQAAMASLQK